MQVIMRFVLCFLVLYFAMVSPAETIGDSLSLTAETHWQRAAADPGDWFDGTNWNGGLPAESVVTWIDNGGTAEIDGGVALADEVLVTGSGDSGLTLSDGEAVFDSGPYVAGDSGTSCLFEMTGGMLTTRTSVSVGSNGTPRIAHSGGTISANTVRVGIRYVDAGTYELSGDAELNSYITTVGGDHGRGEFLQLGGTHSVTLKMILGDASSAFGHYLLEDGTLSTGATFVGERSPAHFEQTGGLFTAGHLFIRSGASFTSRGGTLSAHDSVFAQGTVDFGDGDATVSMAGIVNLGSATIVGGQSTALSLGADSLAIFPAGFDPAVEFASFSSEGLAYQAGQTLTIPAGRTVKGLGTIDEHVHCSGSLLQEVAYLDAPARDTAITLTGGVMVDAGATVRLGSRSTLKISNQQSGIAGGQLQVDDIWIGHNADGRFVQTDGSVTVGVQAMFGHGNAIPSSATYEIHGGSLTVAGDIEVGHYRSTGLFVQTDGEVTAGEDLNLGNSSDGANGTYRISGGELSAEILRIANRYGDATFEVLGSDARIELDQLRMYDRGTLISRIDGGGLSEIAVSTTASLDGQWQVVDDGAPFGRWDVLTAAGGLLGEIDEFDVSLPDPTWKWGTDDGTTVWVEHVPEPSTLLLFAAGAAGLLTCARRRRR